MAADASIGPFCFGACPDACLAGIIGAGIGELKLRNVKLRRTGMGTAAPGNGKAGPCKGSRWQGPGNFFLNDREIIAWRMERIARTHRDGTRRSWGEREWRTALKIFFRASIDDRHVRTDSNLEVT
jgi:hypothetical protein